ncbi:MAG: hypothetical protein R3B48_14425 [Kofleriaceae bacterium]
MPPHPYLVRGAQGLHALISEVSAPATRAAPWQRQHTWELRPLPSTARPDLWRAWRALEAVRSWGADTLRDVLTVLRETVPGLDAVGELPALGPTVLPPPPPRATAAHPRAYRGTKARPPRPPRPAPVDLRPYLLARRHIDQVLELLGQRRGVDAYVAARFGVDEAAAFEPAFVTYLLPLLRGCRWSEVGAFAALASALELHRAPNLRATLVAMYQQADAPARALGWWSHVLAHPPELRVVAAQLVSSSGVARVTPVSAELAAELLERAPAQQWSIYRALAGGATEAYVRAGLQLNVIAEDKLTEVPRGKVDPTELIEATLARLDTAVSEDASVALWREILWTLCGHQPGLVELLAEPAFVALEPRAALWLLRLAWSPYWCPLSAEKEARALAPLLRLFVEHAARAPGEHQRKFAELIVAAYWEVAPGAWPDEPAPDEAHDRALRARLTSALEVCARAARPPHPRSSATRYVLAAVTNVPDEGQARVALAHLRDAPAASWATLERACRRENDARLLGRGLASLACGAPELWTTLRHTPGPLLRTATALAALSTEAALVVLAAHRASPLGAPDASELPTAALCALLEPVARAGGPPVRRALRRHLAGERALSDAQLRGHHAHLVAALDAARLAAIRHAVRRALAAKVGLADIGDGAALHALEVLARVDGHRRQLRRLLTATLAGDLQWRQRHPLTRAWFARHPALDPASWLAGLAHDAELPGVGPVRLATETDPLEALKLGTYVGSCLGRGGAFEYSAAAVILDANKHVVYARDARGAVLARQLIAISETDELVCFSVYGAATLEPLFRDFDHALAERLGLRLHGTPGAEEDYEICSILSSEWWDDDAWTDLAR